ncbi:hypothetical protein N5079_13285 [Planotetraspora sp. A-T 1434]|uniref:hypothetical protein n=1 Tax=Planotetraspora sp. A-T 1434 TaxID=2979219 RepID=UPI0021C07C8D|nr:hypothetical protein [Planotetraspora sp. A-T 1434]MCT9931189.1 hypothetical protein [Planotetraspora sp. A-T 1434]
MRDLAHNPTLDRAAVPMAIPLGAPESLDAELVGDGAALLSRALRLGLPVAYGFVVPAAAINAEDSGMLPALRQAWARTKGPVRIALSVSSPSGDGFGAGPHFHDGSTWNGLLDGLCDVLLHNNLENPYARWRPWSIVVQRVPAVHRSVLAMSGHPLRRQRGTSIWTSVPETENPAESLGWMGRRRLRALARQTARTLGHPVDIEVVYDAQGIGRIVDCRSYGAAPWE